ncbi:hypothetical protein BU23DRAFT_604071 [Bimuria novae-zelandiae CBS 107.79]|uniref:Uncharacterized protein n=1 Tax=Bimuria novae-zelandiae CBS 107.79 TaxID=1447943 RepID=A0A6A5URY2_9PLEO|nr:hypothetical protein BU23DRAFT_604071 [Bimuria novae-zelandiae CBS 107.79]
MSASQNILAARAHNAFDRNYIDVKLKTLQMEHARLALHVVHQTHTDTGFWKTAISPSDMVDARFSTLAAYAAAVLQAKIPDRIQDSVYIEETDFSRVTIVVKKELCINKQTTSKAVSTYVYRVSVYTHISAASNNTLNLLRRDISGSQVLIKGPYVTDLEGTTTGLESDLVPKLLLKRVNPQRLGSAKRLLERWHQPLINGMIEDAPKIPVATWAAVNVSVEDRWASG